MSKFVTNGERWWAVQYIAWIDKPENYGHEPWYIDCYIHGASSHTTIRFDDRDDAWSFFEGVTGYSEEDAG